MHGVQVPGEPGSVHYVVQQSVLDVDGGLAWTTGKHMWWQGGRRVHCPLDNHTAPSPAHPSPTRSYIFAFYMFGQSMFKEDFTPQVGCCRGSCGGCGSHGGRAAGAFAGVVMPNAAGLHMASRV